MKWSLPLRFWLTLALIVVILTPVTAYMGTLIVVMGPSKMDASPWERAATEAIAKAAERLAVHGGADWTSPALHEELTKLLEPRGWEVTLVDDRGRIVFQSRPGAVETEYHSQPGQSDEPVLRDFAQIGSQVVLGVVRDDSGRVTGTYILSPFRPDPLLFWAIAAILAGLTAAVTLVVWRVGRAVSQPVQALTQVARQVNDGYLNGGMPSSRVSELNELSDAFAALKEGLRISLTEQAAMEEERRLFISAIAHDLRTPLTSVRGYLEGLRDNVATTPEKRERYVAVALDKAGQLERLIENLFAYVRTSYLNLSPQKEPVDPSDLLVQAVDAFRSQAAARNIHLLLTTPDSHSCTLPADRLMLNRVLDNLLENALRFTPPGGAINVGWACGDTHCRIWVQDSGPGIPAEDLERIFQPLYRGDKARGSRTGGAGLGLAIARQLVEAHGGRLEVSNHGGARFTVTLPLAV